MQNKWSLPVRMQYFAMFVIKENILLVDVPGVGESEEMDSLVIDYLNKAVACIYVLISANAGGIQRDKVSMLIFI